MSYLRNKRGQAMVEFAIIIPSFIFMLYGFSYMGMFFHDYLTLNEMTRDIARQASVGISFDKIRENYSDQTFLTNIYTVTLDPKNIEDGKDTSGEKNVTVKLEAKLKLDQGSYWREIFRRSGLDTITSSLTMRKEE